MADVDLRALSLEQEDLRYHTFHHAGVFLDTYEGDCDLCRRFYEIDDVIRTIGGRRKAAWDAEMMRRRRLALGPVEE